MSPIPTSAIRYVTIAESRYAPDDCNEINLYSYNGAEGMTLGQLIMSVCISRAAAIEHLTVNKVNELASTTGMLNALSLALETLVQVAQEVTPQQCDTYLKNYPFDLTNTGYTPKYCELQTDLGTFLSEELGLTNLTITDKDISCFKFYQIYYTKPGDAKNYYDYLMAELQAKADTLTGDDKVNCERCMNIIQINLDNKVGKENEIPLDYITFVDTKGNSINCYNYIRNTLGITFITVGPYVNCFDDVTIICNSVEDLIQQYSNLSQEQSIDLESLVNRRDVAYNLSATIVDYMQSGSEFIANKILLNS